MTDFENRTPMNPDFNQNITKSDINNLGVPSIYVSSSQPSNMVAGDVWFVTE